MTNPDINNVSCILYYNYKLFEFLEEDPNLFSKWSIIQFLNGRKIEDSDDLFNIIKYSFTIDNNVSDIEILTSKTYIEIYSYYLNLLKNKECLYFKNLNINGYSYEVLQEFAILAKYNPNNKNDVNVENIKNFKENENENKNRFCN